MKTRYTSSLSSLALWFFGRSLNSLVRRRHSSTFSGETKSTATFVHDCMQMKWIWWARPSCLCIEKGKTTEENYEEFLTLRFLTWCGHPAGINTASPSFCSNVHGSTPWKWITNMSKAQVILQLLVKQIVIGLLCTNQILLSTSFCALNLNKNTGHELDEWPNKKRA